LQQEEIMDYIWGKMGDYLDSRQDSVSLSSFNMTTLVDAC